MKGTVAYYMEQLNTTVMNRLVTNETNTLLEKYEQLQAEIAKETDEILKGKLQRNLKKAFELMQAEMTKSAHTEMYSL
ncbi:MAG TPA: hypothetical protein VK067_05515 [Pseudogracilibacillus sp.]|nr:hypothetical protein [Pseudogracilibacillus sp.]